jgi:hypothetical protein
MRQLQALNLPPDHLQSLVAYLNTLGLSPGGAPTPTPAPAPAPVPLPAPAATVDSRRIEKEDGDAGISALVDAGDGRALSRSELIRVARQRVQQNKAEWTAMLATGREKRIKKELDELQLQPIPNCSAGPAGIAFAMSWF